MPGNGPAWLQPKLCLLPFSWCDKYQKGWNWWDDLGQGSLNGFCLGSLIPYSSGARECMYQPVSTCLYTFSSKDFLKQIPALPVCALRANHSFDGFASGRMESSQLLALVFSTRIPMALGLPRWKLGPPYPCSILPRISVKYIYFIHLL